MRFGPALIAVAAAVSGCGSSEPRLTVAAASSLKPALTEYAASFEGADVKLSFAASDQLAAQIRAGARPDVFASADVQLPHDLFEAGLAERPVVFASNRLALAAPREGRVRTLADLARPGVKIAVASAGVPAGRYAQQLLRRLSPATAANIRSQEPDVGAVLGKVTQGAVDAGFVYATDVRAAGERVREIPLPSASSSRVGYAAAVVRPGAAAHAFVAGLREAPALRRAGFGPP